MTEIFNREKTKFIRRKLRAQPISAEKILWSRLRKKRLGYRFNRQYGIGNYVVDFYCAEKRLIIEVDGATHSSNKEVLYDNRREDYFKRLGLNIKRYLNVDVFNNLDLIVGNIVEFLKR